METEKKARVPEQRQPESVLHHCETLDMCSVSRTLCSHRNNGVGLKWRRQISEHCQALPQNKHSREKPHSVMWKTFKTSLQLYSDEDAYSRGKLSWASVFGSCSFFYSLFMMIIVPLSENYSAVTWLSMWFRWGSVPHCEGGTVAYPGPFALLFLPGHVMGSGDPLSSNQREFCDCVAGHFFPAHVGC